MDPYDQELRKIKLKIQYLKLERDHCRAKHDLFNIIVSRAIRKSQLRLSQQSDDDEEDYLSEDSVTPTSNDKKEIHEATLSEVNISLLSATHIANNIVKHSIIPIHNSLENVNSVYCSVSTIESRANIQYQAKPISTIVPIYPIWTIFPTQAHAEFAKVETSHATPMKILSSIRRSPKVSDVLEPVQSHTSTWGVIQSLIVASLYKQNEAERQSHITEPCQNPYHYQGKIFSIKGIVFPRHANIYPCIETSLQSKIYDPGISFSNLTLETRFTTTD